MRDPPRPRLSHAWRWTRQVQRMVQEAEDILHCYWRQLSPLYLSQHDHHQH
ncbi:hypothetical protein ABT116_37060 [Streptomyces sp. NPDC002130]|uniref:hypothetical protein n=1 Tax=Streptomyces sp. NPDC002130 TaxID=3155568 RepID=UPI003325BB56